MAGNTIHVAGSYIDVHDNENVYLSVDKAVVKTGERSEGDAEPADEEKQEGEADSPTEEQEEPREELNLFAPKRNLQELLKQPWLATVRTDKRYDAAWTDGFLEALMASEYGEGIARQWAVSGVRNKRNQLKGYVVGLLKDAGVLKGSYDAIAARIGLTHEVRTFSSYMGRGKKQPYAGWVKEYVAASGYVSNEG